jgi:hypothetical protein
MTVLEFVSAIPGFGQLTQPEKIKHFAWHLHVHGKVPRFDVAAIRSCYRACTLPEPNISEELRRLADKAPPALLKNKEGYALHLDIKHALDAKYGEHETTIVVSQLLKDLVGKLSSEAERLFLADALKCYRVEAFRPAVIMTWNLAYDHLLNWILKDATRLTAFNARIIPVVGPKKGAGLVMVSREDFEELKESQVIDIIGPALPSANIKSILSEQLNRRNIAAHPSLIEIVRAQADDTITTLVNNVVLRVR